MSPTFSRRKKKSLIDLKKIHLLWVTKAVLAADDIDIYVFSL